MFFEGNYRLLFC